MLFRSETCQVLTRPECMQVQVLPQSLRPWAIDKLEQALTRYNLWDKQNLRTVNTRTQKAQPSNIANDILSYINILKNEPVIDDDKTIQQLKTMLQGFEKLRSNSIIEVAPEYKDWLNGL